MTFWKRPNLPPHPEGCLEIPENAHPAVQAAVRAFNEGNFARCQAQIREALGGELPLEHRSLLEDLRRRLRPDAAHLILSALCLMAGLFVALWAVSVSH